MVQPFYSIDSQVKMYKTLKNEHQDQTVILMSIAFSSLNYVVYIPELVMVIIFLCPIQLLTARRPTLENFIKLHFRNWVGPFHF